MYYYVSFDWTPLPVGVDCAEAVVRYREKVRDDSGDGESLPDARLARLLRPLLPEHFLRPPRELAPDAS